MGFTFSIVAIASLITKISTEIRHLSRSEVREVGEHFYQNQKGSSAMPHKKNPISSENVAGLARYIISSLYMAIENNDLWHERDISHSSNERIYINDDISLLVYILRRMDKVLNDLDVDKEKMIKDIESDNGVIFSGRVLNYVLDKYSTHSREEVYDNIQKLAFKAINENVGLKDLLLQDSYFNKLLSDSELNELFSYGYYFKNIENIYKTIGIK